LEDVTSPMYSTAVGLILKGFEKYKISESFTDSENGKPNKPEENQEAKADKVSGTSKFLDWVKSTTENITDSVFGDLTD